MTTTDTKAPRPHALVIAYGFPPNGSIGTMRTLRLVRHLAATNWRVTVLTASPGDYRSTTPVDPALLERVPQDVKVVRARVIRWISTLESWVRARGRAAGAEAPRQDAQGAASPVAGPGAGPVSFARRFARTMDALLSVPDRESGWLLPALLAGLRVMLFGPRVDVVYSSSPPWTGTVIAYLLAAMARRPWVADFRDPWSRAPWREDRPSFVVRILSFLERRSVARAHRIMFVTRGNRDDFAAFHGSEAARKFEVIANGCDVTEFDGLVPSPEPGRFVLLHAGSLYGGKRDPEPLFRALIRRLADGSVSRESFRVRFLGADSPEKLKELARRHGLADVVEVLPRVGRRESLQAMVSASALLMIQPGHGVSVPGKAYEYFAAGRPILAMTDNEELAELVRESGIGVAVGPSDEGGIAEALLACVSMTTQGESGAAKSLYDGASQAGLTATLLSKAADVGCGRRDAEHVAGAEGTDR